MAKGFTAILKGLGKPTQPEQRAVTPELRPPTRPQLRWRSASDSPLQHELRAHQAACRQTTKGSAPETLVTRPMQSVPRDNVARDAAVDSFDFNIPTVEPSMLGAVDDAMEDVPRTVSHCFELPAHAASPELDTPTSTFSAMTASSLESTPPPSRCSDQINSRADSRLGSAAGSDCRILAADDFIETPSGQFVLPELASGLATGSPLMRTTFMFGEGEADLYHANLRAKSLVWRAEDAAAAMARPTELRRASTHRLSTMTPLSVRLPVRPDPRRCRSAESAQQPSNSVASASGPAYQSMAAAAMATTVTASTPSSQRSSIVSSKRQSRQRKFTSGHKPAPLILSRNTTPVGPPPTLPPAYPPPPNPLQRVEMRVADLEEQLHMLSLKIAALNTFADAATATAA